MLNAVGDCFTKCTGVKSSFAFKGINYGQVVQRVLLTVLVEGLSTPVHWEWNACKLKQRLFGRYCFHMKKSHNYVMW